MCRAQIDAAINDDNSTMEDFPMQKVAIPTGETDFTSFQVLSPEEIRIAKVCNFVRRHKLGEMSEDDTWAFIRLLMSVPTTIIVLDSVEMIFFEAIKIRRSLMKTAKLACRSGNQVVDEIVKISALIEASVDNSPSHQSVGPSQDGPGADNLSIKFVGKFDDLAGSQTKTCFSSI